MERYARPEIRIGSCSIGRNRSRDVEVSRYCLDTSAYIEFLRGEPRTVATIDRASWVGFPAIALGELYAGFALSRRHEEDATRLRDFLAHPVVETIQVDDEVAHEYGQLVAELRTARMPLPAKNMWIAACAARTSSVVLTRDSHFTRIARLGCVVLRRPGLRRTPGGE